MSELLYIRIIFEKLKFTGYFLVLFFSWVLLYSGEKKNQKKNDVYILLCFAYPINSTMDLRFFKLHRFLITMQMY